MQQHYDMKHKLKEFHCDIADCDYFSNSQEQLDHQRRRNHRATFKFRCSKCHFVSVTSAELGQHSATDHSTVYLPPQENLEQLCFLCHQSSVLGLCILPISVPIHKTNMLVTSAHLCSRHLACSIPTAF